MIGVWSGMFWDVLGCLGMFWDILGCSGIFWDVLGCTGMLWDIQGFSGIFWDVLESVLQVFKVMEVPNVGQIWIKRQ